MTNPFRYRPEETSEEEGPEDWEDNALSNAMAWGADKILPSWCATPTHWTSKLSGYFWTDCPCCLFFRGAIFGIAMGVVGAYVFTKIVSFLLGD